MGAAARALLVAVLLAASSAACDTRPALSFAPDTLPDATVGQPYSVTITVAGNVTPLGEIYPNMDMPPGLMLDYDQEGHGNSAELHGTPSAAGTFQVPISAWCLGTNVSGQSGTRQYTLVVR